MTKIFIMTSRTIPMFYTTDIEVAKDRLGDKWDSTGDQGHRGCNTETGEEVYEIVSQDEMDGESEIWVAMGDEGVVLTATIELSTICQVLADDFEAGNVRSCHAVGGPSTYVD